MSLIPGRHLPETGLDYTDLLAHVSLYAFWITITGVELHRQFVSPVGRYIKRALIIYMLYGGLMEILQGTLIEGRYASWSDVLANTAGLLLGTALYHLKSG